MAKQASYLKGMYPKRIKEEKKEVYFYRRPLVSEKEGMGINYQLTNWLSPSNYKFAGTKS